MKKLTTSVLTVVLSASFAVANAQETPMDTTRTVNIGEVVITGALGIKKRQDAVTSANQVVNADEIQQAKNPNPVQALTGKVSGLQINTTNTSVNSSNRVVLRGPRSITGNNQVLVVIDGVISTLGILQNLPPEIIDNMNVIKGMQGAALYGEQGSNGVIIVNTKRGSRSERLTFTLNSSIDFSSVYKLPIYQQVYGQGWPGDSFDPTDYNGTTWTPYENSNWGPSYSSALGGQNLIIGMPQRDNSWITETFSPKKNHLAKFFNTGVLFQNGISVNAGDQDGYTFFSFNRADNDFVVEKDQLKRNNFILKAGKKLGNFRIDANINYLNLTTSTTNSSLYGQLIQTPTNLDIRKFRNSLPDEGPSAYTTNPYWTIDNERYDTRENIISGLLNLAYDINDNISLTYAGTVVNGNSLSESHNNGFAMDRYYSGTGTYVDDHYYYEFGVDPVVSNYFKSTGNTLRYYGDLMANFDYDLTDDLNLKLNIGHNIQDSKSSTTSVGGENLQIAGWYHFNNVLNAEKPYNLNNNSSRVRSFAWFANLDLNYRDYLFLNSTFRYEKSSRLSSRATPVSESAPMSPLENTGYPYYSFGLSFVPTKAFEGLRNDVLNYAKVSLGYTVVGNASNVGAYGLDQVGVFPTGYPFGNISSYLPQTSVYDPNGVDPEFFNSKEANLMLGLFRDRVTFEGSVYRNDTDNLFSSVQRSSASGITSVLDNIGSSRNQGFELDLGIVPLKTTDFEWRLRGSYSKYRTTITSLTDGVDEVAVSGVYSQPAVAIYAVVGEDFPMIKGTKYQRDPNGNIIVGANGNPLATSTLEILGKVNPDYILGFSTSFKFKRFTLSGTADYRTGNKFVAFTRTTLGFTGALEKTAEFDRSQGYIVPGSVQNTGTAANPVYVTNTTPVGGVGDYTNVTNYFAFGNFANIGEEHVVDGSAFKVREIALTYDLPRAMLDGTFVNTLSVGVYARNPIAIYASGNRNFADPETTGVSGNNGMGLAFANQYPTIRNFGFNFNVTF